MIRIKRGLDIPISGLPQQKIHAAPAVKTVALTGPDYIGMKPAFEVEVNDRVKLGQLLFTDRKNPGVRHTAPGAGRVLAIHRGEKRAFQSIVILLDGHEEETFASYAEHELPNLPRQEAVENLVDSGLWTSFRTRPFDKVPAVENAPHSIFVTAIDTNPLAAEPEVVIKEHPRDFTSGLTVLSRLTDGPLFLVKAPAADVPAISQATVEEFDGPHPAGLPGTHIHFLDPADLSKTVWHIGYQDVIAIGKLFLTGRLWTQRVISIGGPGAARPRLLRTRLGASISELVKGELKEGSTRVISGSALCGAVAAGPLDFLGRYHLQISVLPEGKDRRFLGWLRPGGNEFSVKKIYAASFFRQKRFTFSTSQKGAARAIYPVGTYEKVMPLDMLATPLLRALAAGDTDEARQLGCLELAEEDLALCSFVCPGKSDFGAMLRRALTAIEMEGL